MKDLGQLLQVTELGILEYRKVKLFPSTHPVTDYCALVSAGQHGLVFTGSSAAELKGIYSSSGVQ